MRNEIYGYYKIEETMNQTDAFAIPTQAEEKKPTFEEIGERIRQQVREEGQQIEEQLKKPSRARLNPDAIPVLAIAVGMVSVLMVASFIVSFSGIYDVSAWTGIPKSIQWLPALFIDAAILAYTISLVVFKARGESLWRTLLGLSAFAGISVIANISHTLSFWDGSLTDFRAWIGVLITGAAPIAVLLASEEKTRLAFEPAKKSD